jgi:hypothetical protein
MSVTVVNEWWFRKDANIEEAKVAALELVEYFNQHDPSVQLSLWIEDSDDPLHHFHITVLDDRESLMRLRESDGIRRFIEKFWPHIIRDETYKSPSCDVWLCKVNNLQDI